jgi:flagellar M-ring protein FliF
MDVSDVVIVDSLGKLLSKNSADPMAVATATQLEFRQAIERETESRIEAMLNRVVGDGRVVARVSAELDFSVVNETQTVFDGDGSAVRSSQKNSATQEGLRPSPSGLAGAKSNLPDQQNPAPAPGIKSNTNQNFEVTNYEVPQTIRKTTKPQGGIKKLSVAVVVDAKRTKIPGVDGKAGTTQIEPWSPEKLKEFEEMVVSAAGVDRKRGDVLDIKSMEFKDEDFEEASRVVAENERKTYTQSLIIYGVIGLTIVLFFFLVIRPFVKWITENTVDSVDTYLPQTIEELEKIQKGSMMAGLDDAVPELQERIDPDKVEGEMLKEKIIALVDTNPHKAAIILRDWLVGGAAKPAGDEKSNGKAASA